ncbi:hypothetical protein CBS101457_006105 [Exobasidium rhododendri]|nr:hypothetical protein CBS101457_006105 [Exobasidium rhododendri]
MKVDSSKGRLLVRLIPRSRCFSTTSIHSSWRYERLPTRRDDQGRLLSRVSGPTDVPLSTNTLGQFWTSIVKKFADRPALIVKHEPRSQLGSLSDGNVYGGSKKDEEENKRGRDARISDDCIRWSYAEMDVHVREILRGMRRIGVKRGDRVAVLMMNNSAMACLQIATALLGAILVTLNPSYTAKELLRSMNHVGASHLFIVPSLRSSDYVDKLLKVLPSLSSSRATSSLSNSINDEACPTLRTIILIDNLSNRPQGWESQSLLATEGKGFDDAFNRLNGKAISYLDILQANDDANFTGKEEADLNCHDVINLQFTSGTTGSPKAVALTSHNLVNNGIACGDSMNLTERDVLANIPPLFHCFGLTLGNLAAFSHGSAILFPSEGFDPVRALRAASEEKATAIHGVPAHFIAELSALRQLKQAQKSGDWSEVEGNITKGEEWKFNLRTGFTSGSTVPIELMRAIMDDDLLGAKEQTVVYGMTETSPVSFACDTTAAVKLRCNTVGTVIAHAHAKIVSPDDEEGKPLPIGQVGELCSGGYIVMNGYWNDQERTKKALQVHSDEPEITWMRTGDLAVIDEHGYAEIRGRVKDLIIRGGENLTAVGIENCVDALPGVASSAAVAVPDEKMGEAVGVFISRVTAYSASSASLSREAIRAHVKEHLSGQSAPDWIWFMCEDGVAKDFPTTASGKVQKVILREWAKTLSEAGLGRVRKSTVRS